MLIISNEQDDHTKNCINSIWESLEGMERHLLTYGISPSYCEWVYDLGESINLPWGFERVATHSLHNDEETSNVF